MTTSASWTSSTDTSRPTTHYTSDERTSQNQKNSEFAAQCLQACTAANMLGSKADRNCANCTILYKVNAANCAALLDDRNLRQQLLQDPDLNIENLVAKIKNYEAATKLSLIHI